MSSLRAWLLSGTFAAAMSAGVLCGAGLAAADTDGSPAAPSSAAHAAKPSPGSGAAQRASAGHERVVSAAASRGAHGRAVPVLSAAAVRKSGKSAPPAAAKPVAAQPVAPAASVVTSAPAPAAAVVPSSVPVDPAKYAGTYYEQGSVKQFFAIGLVNTSATYTANPDGTIKVQNSGNYFFNRGPRSSIVGSAVPVNATNTALNVGLLSPRPPSATPPGNYTILETAPDYSYVLVSDPSGRSGYILTRSKTISPEEYQRLTDRARALGVTGRITPTRQFPA